jgi:hypothetical protein
MFPDGVHTTAEMLADLEQWSALYREASSGLGNAAGQLGD